jgi:hypothetical protein
VVRVRGMCEAGNALEVSLTKPKRKEPLGRIGHRWIDNVVTY